MKKRALVPILFAALFTAVLLARPAYAASGGTISNGDGTGSESFDSLGQLQQKIDARFKREGSNFRIRLDNDLAGGPLEIYAKTTVTMDMAGHTIDRGLSKQNKKGHVILINKDARVTINGGDVTSTKNVKTWNANGGTENKSLTTGGLITGGYSTNKSGGIHLEGGARLTLNNVTIAGCRAEQNWGSDGYGGGIRADGDDITVAMNNSTITGCYAYNDGGGVYSEHTRFNLFMSNSHIDANYAKRNAGGVALMEDKAVLSGSNGSTVNNNRAIGNYGGGVYANKDGISIKGLTISNNSAANGGGICTGAHDITISGCTITNNLALRGGGVYIGDFTNIVSTATDAINSCIIKNNRTTQNSSYKTGAGVYVNGNGRGWFVKRFALDVGGTCIITDNGNGSGNLVLGSTGVCANFGLVGESKVAMGYESISEDAVQVTHSRTKTSNCLRCLVAENSGYHFTYNEDGGSRKIFYVKDGKDNTSKYGKPLDAPKSVTTLSPANAGPTPTSRLNNGYPIFRGYVRLPSAVDDNKDIATPFFYSDGYFFGDPNKYDPHLATASLCMAMSGFYLNTGAHTDYTNKHASGRQFLADIGCADDSIYVNDFNVQKPTTSTIGVTIGRKELKDSNGKFDSYLVPVIIRGSNYEAEWASNVTLNDSSTGEYEAAGFKDAANKVYKEVSNYLARNNIDWGSVKFWIAGYSRAGATTNLTCRRILDYQKPKALYGYPMEAPQGGTDRDHASDDSRYYSIHNVINRADIVPLVGPSAMGFRRYGVDHYIPGSDASVVRITTEDINRSGTDAVKRRTLSADNEAYLTNDKRYFAQVSKARAQVGLIDPTIVFDDYFMPATINFVPPGISEKPTDGVYEERFLHDLLNKMQEWAIADRNAYARDWQPTFRQVMEMLFSMPDSRSKAFVDRASTTLNRFNTIYGSGDDHGLARIWYSVIGEWNKSDAKKKKEYTDLFYRKLGETGALEVLTPVERETFKNSFPKLLDLVLRLVDGDYRNKSYDKTTMMMLGSMAYNVSRIMSNHYPEVTLAWLRSYDDYYATESTPYVLGVNGNVAAPSGQVGNQELKADQTVTVPANSKTVKLDVKDLKGEAVYYQLFDANNTRKSADTCRNGFDIYREHVDLGNVKQGEEYRIVAYAMSYGAKSAQVTYRIKIGATTHKVTVFPEVDYEWKSQGTEHEWAEGSTNTIEAQNQQAQPGAVQNKFERWRVLDEKGNDVATKVLGADGVTKAKATFVMPEGGKNGFSENYSLRIKAVHKSELVPYAKHKVTVKVGDKTETFQVEEGKWLKHSVTLPEDKYFAGWRVIDGEGASAFDVTKYFSLGKDGNLYVKMPHVNVPVPGPDAEYRFQKGYALTFEAQLEQPKEVTKVTVSQLGAFNLNNINTVTVSYTASGGDMPNSTYGHVWKSTTESKVNPDTTVTTTTTWTTAVRCNRAFGFKFADAPEMHVTGPDGNEIPADQVTWEKLDGGDGMIRITVKHEETKGTPTFNHTVTIEACDVNDPNHAVLKRGETDIRETRTVKVVENEFELAGAPAVSNGQFCGYEVPAGSGLERVGDATNNRFTVTDAKKEIKVRALYKPIVSEVRVSSFPQPAAGETLATELNGDVFEYRTESDASFGSLTRGVERITWKPAASDGKAAGNTAYCAEVVLKAASEGGSDFILSSDGVAVTTDSEHPAFVSAKADVGTNTLYLYFAPTARSTDHKVTVVDNADEPVASRELTWTEGETQSVTAKDSYADKYFTGWTIKSGETVLTGDRLATLGLNDAKLKSKTLVITMPAPNDNNGFAQDYSLSVTANYAQKFTGLTVGLAAPSDGDADLADTTTLRWGEAAQAETVGVPVLWTAATAYDEATEKVSFTARINLDASQARKFVVDPAPTVELDPEVVGATTQVTRNADGSLTITVRYPEVTTVLPAYKVTVEAYDVNNPETKLSGIAPTEQTIVNDGAFTLVAPAIPGAEFCGWSVPGESKVTYNETKKTFSFQGGATAADNCTVHALYKPVASEVALSVPAPVAGSTLAQAGDAQAHLKFSEQTVAAFGAERLFDAKLGEGDANNARKATVTNLSWQPAGADAAHETEYMATVKCGVKKEGIDVDWQFGRADDITVNGTGWTAAGTDETGAAYLLFPETARNDTHEVTVCSGVVGEPTETYRLKEGMPVCLTAKAYADKIFAGWTITNAASTDVTDVVLDGDQVKKGSVVFNMPVPNDGSLANDYALRIQASYRARTEALGVALAIPTAISQELVSTATLSWKDSNDQDGSAQVPVMWSASTEETTDGENMITKVTYTATMQLDAEKATDFTDGPTVTVTPADNVASATATRNGDGGLTITVVSNQIVQQEALPVRTVTVQACDTNASGHPKLANVADDVTEFVVDPADPNRNVIVVDVPVVEGAELCGWENPLPEGVSLKQVDGDYAVFEFAESAAVSGPFTLKALFKPQISVIDVSFAAPESGQNMATTAIAKVTNANVDFRQVEPTVSIAWVPADTQAQHNVAYTATATLDFGTAQYAYADDLLAHYSDTLAEGYAEREYTDGTFFPVGYDAEHHQAKVEFDSTRKVGFELVSITVPDDVYTNNANNNAAAVKGLLPAEVGITVIPNSDDAPTKASVTWEEVMQIENGGKMRASEWLAKGKITLPDGVSLDEGMDEDELEFVISVIVAPAVSLRIKHVVQPDDVHGADHTNNNAAAVRSMAPAEVTLVLEEDEEATAEVEWGDPVLEEDGGTAGQSVWSITGRVKEPLPAVVSNPDDDEHVDLTVMKLVYVNPPAPVEKPEVARALAPYATVDDGVYETPQVIYLDTEEAEGTVYYTTDVNAEEPQFVAYQGEPIELDRSTIDEDGMLLVMAYTAAPGKENSDTQTFVYALDNYIDVPEGDELVFDGYEQTGVWGTENYTLVAGSDGARIDEYGDAVATNAGTYTVTAKIGGGLQWELERKDASEDEDAEPGEDYEYEIAGINAQSDPADSEDEWFDATLDKEDKQVTFTIAPAQITDCVISEVPDQSYDGTAKTPEPTLVFNDEFTLQKDRDYTLAYENNVEAGKGKIIITGKGNFTRTTTVEFFIRGDAITYVVTHGNNGTWTRGSADAYELRFERNVKPEETFAHFTGIKVDGQEVEASNYDAESGSVIIRLKPAYLESLSTGAHELEALFDDASNKAVARFTVVDAGSNNGGSSNGDASNGGGSDSGGNTGGGSAGSGTASGATRNTLPRTADPTFTF